MKVTKKEIKQNTRTYQKYGGFIKTYTHVCEMRKHYFEMNGTEVLVQSEDQPAVYTYLGEVRNKTDFINCVYDYFNCVVE